MANYDGYIRIDSRIESKHFNQGVNSMGNQVRGLGKILAAVFSAAVIFNFGKSAVQTASQLATSLMGLESIVLNTGRSFKEAKEFIQDYISDGLVPIVNATQAYKNLALRGYDTSQIKDIMNTFKDTASFGRQMSYTMGEAIQSATEGLKNELSVLVDNAGVTKNVAKMWRDYAEEIGTTAGNLTLAQKRQAEYNGIMREGAYMQGDHIKLLSTYQGQVSMLGFAFYNLKVAVGNILMPVLKALIPIVIAIIKWFTILANTIAQVFNALFGTSVSIGTYDDLAASAEGAADSQENLGSAVEGAGKAAKGALAAFDELNVLQQEEPAAGAAGPPEIGLPPPTPIEGEGLLDEVSAEIQAFVDNLEALLQPALDALDRLRLALDPFKEFVAQGLRDFYDLVLVPIGTWVLGEGLPRFIDGITYFFNGINWEGLNEALRDLWDSLTPFALTIGEGLLTFWEKVMVPIATWTVTEVVPVFLEGLAAVLDVLTAVLADLQPLFDYFYTNILVPLAEWTGGAIVTVLEGVNEGLKGLATWITDNPGKFSDFVVTMGALTIAFELATVAVGLYKFIMEGTTIVAAVIRLALDVLTGTITLQSAAMWIATAASTAFAAVMTFLSSPVVLITLAIVALIAIIYLLIKYWPQISKAASDAWEWIKETWKIVAEWFDENVIQPVMEFFRPLFEFIGIMFNNAWAVAKYIWSAVAQWFYDSVVAPIINIFAPIVETLGGMFSDLWEDIEEVWVVVADWFQEKVLDPITKGWGEFTDDLKKVWGDTWDAVGRAIKSSVNTIIGWINTFVGGVIRGINSIIASLNTMGDLVPGWKNIPSLGTPVIPTLAAGAVIPPNAAFMAVLGDQKRGTNIEAPEELIRQIVREEAGSNNGSQEININFGGTIGQLIQQLKPYIDKENTRIGKSLVKGMF